MNPADQELLAMTILVLLSRLRLISVPIRDVSIDWAYASAKPRDRSRPL